MTELTQAPDPGTPPPETAAPRAFRTDILTLFPGLFAGFLDESLIGKARARGLLSLHLHDWRAFATDKHSKVDDAPFGGGAGMVIKPDPVMACVAAVRALQEAEVGQRTPLVLLSPAGRPFDQATARRWAAGPGITLLCGRYEGFDARVEEAADELVSLGDYVLNGGEVAAMAIVEATARLRPGMVGNAASLGSQRGLSTAAGANPDAVEESHGAGLLEYPHYTRPRVWQGQEVPAILLSGDHAKIATWRREQAEARTRERRPDLWAAYAASRPPPPAKKGRRRRRKADSGDEG